MRRGDLVLIGVSTVLGLGAVELGLRLTHVGPWQPFADLAAAPTMVRPDPALGWTNAPGRHAFTDHAVTVGADGWREVPGSRAPASVWLTGGSFVYGYGLPDDQTLAARLQAARPDLAVANHGVPGWGTVQSWLSLQATDDPVRHVVYGLVDLHDARNAAAWTWLHALDRSGTGNAWKAVPSVWWDGEALHSRAPRAYQHWPISERIAVLDLTERAWLRLCDRIEGRKSEATVQAALAFAEAARDRGAEFTPVLLHAPRRAEYYLRRFAEEGMPLYDLRDRRFPAHGALPDGHPNAATQAAWARDLSEIL